MSEICSERDAAQEHADVLDPAVVSFTAGATNIRAVALAKDACADGDKAAGALDQESRDLSAGAVGQVEAPVGAGRAASRDIQGIR